MQVPDEMYFEIQKLNIDLALINRNHYLAKTNRRENDIEHSFTVALLCWYIHNRYDLTLDIAKILKYAARISLSSEIAYRNCVIKIPHGVLERSL